MTICLLVAIYELWISAVNIPVGFILIFILALPSSSSSWTSSSSICSFLFNFILFYNLCLQVLFSNVKTSLWDWKIGIWHNCVVSLTVPIEKKAVPVICFGEKFPQGNMSCVSCPALYYPLKPIYFLVLKLNFNYFASSSSIRLYIDS